MFYAPNGFSFIVETNYGLTDPLVSSALSSINSTAQSFMGFR
jgi:hypothetical protein